MIRTYSDQDWVAVHQMVMVGTERISESELRERVNGEYVVVYTDKIVQGCAVVQPNPDATTRAGVWLYTDPGSRNQGIGRTLWAWTEQQLMRLGVTAASTDFLVPDEASARFFETRGFKKGADVDLFVYDGGKYEMVELPTVMPYTDTLFHDYVKLQNEAFHDLRVRLNLQPYDVFSTEDALNTEVRKAVASKRDDIFFFYDDGRLVGLAELSGRFVDTVAVCKNEQSKGYGRVITQFAVNQLIARGIHRVYLGVAETNDAASQLYSKLGFKRVETTRFSRWNVQ